MDSDTRDSLSLTLYYPSGAPLAFIPPNAIKVTYDRHKSTKPNCTCQQCAKYRTNPEAYEDIMKEYTPEAIKKKHEKVLEMLYGSMEDYRARQARALQMAEFIMETDSSYSTFQTPQDMADHIGFSLLEALFKEKGGSVEEEKESKSKKRKYDGDDIKSSAKLYEGGDDRDCRVCQGSGDNLEFVCPDCGCKDYMHGGTEMMCMGCGKDWDDQMECKHCGGTGIKMAAPPSKKRRRTRRKL